MLCPLYHVAFGQLSLFQPADSIQKTRFWTLTGGLGVGYSVSLYQLNDVWYNKYERSSLHSFDDLGEWRDVDKGGHLYASYLQADLIHSAYRWSGVNDKTSAWLGVAWSFSGQLSFELLDGHTAQWGFSWYDLLSNAAGSGLFLAQQLHWKEQRIRLKYSIHPVDHPNVHVLSEEGEQTYALQERINELYGSGLERVLKDYNGHTIWLSVNPASFIEQRDHMIPEWLNIAIGYGAENLYGGFHNKWSAGGKDYKYPISRNSEWYLSPDIDLSRIETNSRFLRTILDVLNIIKIPLPTLEYHTDGQWQWHWLYF